MCPRCRRRGESCTHDKLQSRGAHMTNARLVHSWFLAGVASALIGSAALSGPALSQAVQDPGVRGGPPGAGGPLSGLGAAETAFFTAARGVFQEIDSVSGTIAGENGAGLGPRFNLNGCAGCHSQPAVGGTSPAVNPQVAVAALHGARNAVPPFIQVDGPLREAPFLKNPDGSPARRDH